MWFNMTATGSPKLQLPQGLKLSSTEMVLVEKLARFSSRV